MAPAIAGLPQASREKFENLICRVSRFSIVSRRIEVSNDRAERLPRIVIGSLRTDVSWSASATCAETSVVIYFVLLIALLISTDRHFCAIMALVFNASRTSKCVNVSFKFFQPRLNHYSVRSAVYWLGFAPTSGVKERFIYSDDTARETL